MRTRIIAGGTEATINELATAGFANCMALSNSDDPEDACTPFDKCRTGSSWAKAAWSCTWRSTSTRLRAAPEIYAGDGPLWTRMTPIT